MGSGKKELYGSLHGQSGSMDPGRRAFAADVFLDYKETEPVFRKINGKEGEDRRFEAFCSLFSFLWKWSKI